MSDSKTAVTERIIIGHENNGIASTASRLSPEMVQEFDGKSKEVNWTNTGTTIISHSFIYFQSYCYAQHTFITPV
jgi:hypothetical protein